MNAIITAALITLVVGVAEPNKCWGPPTIPTVRQTTKNDMEVTPANEQDVFELVKPLLLQKTVVPLRLPSFVPFGEEKSPVYAIIRSAGKSGYDIELGWTKDCTGGNACHYGTARGSSSKLPENDGPRVAVMLGHGIEGYFIDFTCNAHCDDAAVGWAENGFHYSISLKAGKKETLIKMANSAIESHHKQN